MATVSATHQSIPPRTSALMAVVLPGVVQQMRNVVPLSFVTAMVMEQVSAQIQLIIWEILVRQFIFGLIRVCHVEEARSR